MIVIQSILMLEPNVKSHFDFKKSVSLNLVLKIGFEFKKNASCIAHARV